MGTPIWQANGEAVAEIRVNLDQQGLGWFTLTAISAHNGPVDLRRIDAEDADGDAYFRVTPSDDLLFKLQVLCASPAAPGSGVWLRVLQNGAVLPCVDTDGDVVNGNAAGGFRPIQLGTVVQGQNQIFNFDIWE
jgi:hypothetical protein